MNVDVIEEEAPSSVGDSRGAANREAGPRAWRWLALIILIYLVFGLIRLGSYDLQPDEGRFGISGLNILADYHQLATVSEEPLGGPGTKAFMYPLEEAASLWLFGKNEYAVRGVDVLLLLGAGLLLRGFCRDFTGDEVLSALCGALFLLNPGTISYARTAMPEPSVVFWGCLALFFCGKFYRRENLSWALLCGAALGCAFLSKMWLVLPFGIACAVLFGAKLAQRLRLRFALIALAAFVAFLAVASCHLLVVKLLAPGELPYWRGMYFGTTLSSRVAGVGYDPAMWIRPWWFYFAALFRASFFALPFVITGAIYLWRQRLHVLAAVAAAMLVPVLLLSRFSVKEAAYVFPVFPGMIILMAAGLLWFLRARKSSPPLILSCVAAGVLGLWFRNHGVLGWHQLGLVLLLYGAYVLAGLIGKDDSLFPQWAAAALLLAAMLFTTYLSSRRDFVHRTYFREAAAFFKNDLQARRPQDVSFISPEYASLSFYTFRNGEYWRTYTFQRKPSAFRAMLSRPQCVFYVVDPAGRLYGGSPTREEWAALAEGAREVTPEVERRVGHDLPLRIFVPLK